MVSTRPPPLLEGAESRISRDMGPQGQKGLTRSSIFPTQRAFTARLTFLWSIMSTRVDLTEEGRPEERSVGAVLVGSSEVEVEVEKSEERFEEEDTVEE